MLDTHVLLWLDAASPRLGKRAIKVIEGAHQAGEVMVSSISFWEIGTLLRKGRIELEMDLTAWRSELLEQGVVELPVTGEIGVRAAALHEFGGNPADRLIAATALQNGLSLVTADKAILASPLQSRMINAAE